MSLREKVAIAISGAPFPSTASLKKADAAIAAVMKALEEPSNGMDAAGNRHFGEGVCHDDGRWSSLEDCWKAMLRQFKVEQGI